MKLLMLVISAQVALSWYAFHHNIIELSHHFFKKISRKGTF